ncbi:hypothetical protein KSS87_009235, partial [Heliosperma pusillum]
LNLRRNRFALDEFCFRSDYAHTVYSVLTEKNVDGVDGRIKAEGHSFEEVNTEKVTFIRLLFPIPVSLRSGCLYSFNSTSAEMLYFGIPSYFEDKEQQQQFFEQRKRQQQQQEATNVESHNDSPVAYTQQKGNRSLDILSLLNVTKVAEECRPACISESTSMMANKAPRAKAFEAVEIRENHQSSTRSPTAMTNEVAAADYVEPTATKSGTLSSYQGEKVSSKGTWKNTSMAKNAESKCWRIDSSIRLGDLGTETPKQSPQQPARISCDDKSSFSKATKKLHFRKNLNSMLDQLEMETECFLHDTEEPTCDNHLDSFLISEDVLSPLSYSEHELSPVKAGNKHSTKQWERNSLNEDRDTNFWNGMGIGNYIGLGPSFLDGNIANNKCGLNWTNGDANMLRNVSPVFGSEEQQLRPRSQEHKTGRYNHLGAEPLSYLYVHVVSLDTLTSECYSLPLLLFFILDWFVGYACQMKEIVYFVLWRNPSMYSSFMCNHKRQATCLSPYMGMEDRRDNLTSLSLSSEESCSSTAVRGRKFAGMSSERHVRRCDEDLPWQLNSNAEDNLHEEMQDIMTHENRRAEECNRSRKYQRSNVGHTKSAYISEGMLNERFHVEDSWLPESKFPLGNTDTDTIPGIFTKTSLKNRHCLPRRDPFGTTNVQDDPPNTSGCRSGIFEKKTPGEFSPENIPFFQTFCPRQSFKTSFSMGGSYKESSCGVRDNLNIHAQSPNLADVADCFGDIEAAFPVPELSAQGSVTLEAGDKLKSKSEKIDQNSAQSMNTSHESKPAGEETSIKENGTPFCKENNSKHKVIITDSLEEDAEETSPPVMIQREFDDKLNTKIAEEYPRSLSTETQSVADVNCFVTKSVNNDNLKGFEAKTSLIEFSCQVMTVERYVFQLFCVPQQKAAMWDTTKRLS